MLALGARKREKGCRSLIANVLQTLARDKAVRFFRRVCDSRHLRGERDTPRVSLRQRQRAEPVRAGRHIKTSYLAFDLKMDTSESASDDTQDSASFSSEASEISSIPSLTELGRAAAA